MLTLGIPRPPRAWVQLHTVCAYSRSPGMAEMDEGKPQPAPSAPPPQEPGQASSLGLSHAYKKQSTVIIIINWFIYHTTFCLLDSPTAHQGQCLLAGAGLSPVLGHSSQSMFGQDHSTHLLQSLTPSVLSFQWTLLYSHEAECKAGSILPNTWKSSHTLPAQAAIPGDDKTRT